MVNQKKGPKKRPWQVSKKKVTSHSVFETQERKEMTHGSKRGLRVESPMAGDELTCWAGTKNQTFKVKYCESDIV